MSAFDDAFTDFVRAPGRVARRHPGAVLERWSSFVVECEHGYRGDEFAYGNEAMARTTLEAALTDPGLHAYPETGRAPPPGRGGRRAVPPSARWSTRSPASIPTSGGCAASCGERAGGWPSEWKRSFGFDVEVVRQPRSG